ncbi:MAG: hypothetical protein MUF84_17860 [Anaerolineae bacterium]|nr:hypothetical protein [Anaerolineae bacterium]
MNVARLIEKLGAGAYWERMPLRYAIYLDGESERREFAAIKAQPFWKWS